MDEEKPNFSTDLEEVLNKLTPEQIRYVIQRVDTSTDREAALALGIRPNQISKWKRYAPIDEAVHLMIYDGLTTALHIRRRSLAKAMAIKAEGLDSGDERLRQSVATEIVEWELGKATQNVRQDVTSGGRPIKGYAVISPDDWDGDDEQ